MWCWGYQPVETCGKQFQRLVPKPWRLGVFFRWKIVFGVIGCFRGCPDSLSGKWADQFEALDENGTGTAHR